jgi:hypothetical protein
MQRQAVAEYGSIPNVISPGELLHWLTAVCMRLFLAGSDSSRKGMQGKKRDKQMLTLAMLALTEPLQFHKQESIMLAKATVFKPVGGFRSCNRPATRMVLVASNGSRVSFTAEQQRSDAERERLEVGSFDHA